MPLDRIDISNLKSLGTKVSGLPHQVPLAPITLLYGPNSAGKTTIIQALSVLRELLLQERPPDDWSLPSRTPIFDLGSFRSTIHRHDESLPLRLGLRLRDANAYVGLEFRGAQPAEPARGVPSRAFLHQAAIGSSDQPVLFDLRENERGRRYFELPERGWTESLLPLLSDSIAQADRDSYSALEDALQARKDRPGPRFPLSTGWLPAIPEPDYIPHPEANRLFLATIDAAIDKRVRAVRDTLEHLFYLGPLRAAPTRLQTVGAATTTDVGMTGEATATVLRDEAVRRTVNLNLSSLGIDYELHVDSIAAQPADDRSTIDVSNVVALTLVHTRDSKVTVSPRDVGFGVSQVLPVVVQCAAASDSLICVEQPEVHIHPRLQTELADIFVASARERGNQIIIETHSEHLMLRIKSLIRNNNGGWLTPDMVSVIYVDVDDRGHAHPTRLPLDDDGEFTVAWPRGFFTERYDEYFGLNQA